MPEPTDPTTLWLTVTNVALGLTTALAVVVVAARFLAELAGRRQPETAPGRRQPETAPGHRRGAGAARDPHPQIIHLPDLGPTMADGGDPSRQRE